MINIYFYYSFIIGLLIIIIGIYISTTDLFIEYKTSPFNNKLYGIQEIFSDTHIAIELLSKIHDKMLEYSDVLKSTYPTDERVIRLYEKLHSTKIEEAPFENNTSSYTINKGELMAICLRPHDIENKYLSNFHDENTLWFVVSHEMAHIMSLSEGHNSEFVNNFKFILQTSHQLGFYNNPVNYKTNPITYCGVNVTNNPFY